MLGPEVRSGRYSVSVRLGPVTDPGDMETDYFIGILPVNELTAATRAKQGSYVPFLTGEGVALSLSAGKMCSGQWSFLEGGKRQTRSWNDGGSGAVGRGEVLHFEIDLDTQSVACYKGHQSTALPIPIKMQGPVRFGLSMFCTPLTGCSELRSVAVEGEEQNSQTRVNIQS